MAPTDTLDTMPPLRKDTEPPQACASSEHSQNVRTFATWPGGRTSVLLRPSRPAAGGRHSPRGSRLGAPAGLGRGLCWAAEDTLARSPAPTPAGVANRISCRKELCNPAGVSLS